MRNNWIKILFFLFSSSILMAGTDGQIRGSVKNIEGERLVGAQVYIDDAQLGMDGTIKLSNVVLTAPGMRSDSNQLFTADHILIRHNIWSLLRGRFEAESLTLDHPTIYLIEDLSTGKYNYQMFNATSLSMILISDLLEQAT